MKWNGIFPRLFTKNDISFSTEYQNYLKSYAAPNMKSKIVDQSFVVFDTETTGFDLSASRLLSLGAVMVQNNSFHINQSLSIAFQQSVRHTEDAVAIHGIVTNEQIGLAEEEVIKIFYDYIGSSVIVGHHTAFDLQMVEYCGKKYGFGPILNPTLDTSYLAKRLDNPYNPMQQNPKDYSLDALCERFDIIAKARHTADGDAYLTALVFMKIVKQFELKGVFYLKDILKN